MGLDPEEHDVRFVEDDWESPTLGAWGLGWEVWLDGMEITQFTYFQQVGGVELDPVSVELTYGLERILMYLQDVTSVYDLTWSEDRSYGDVHLETEREYSSYFFDIADPDRLREWFRQYEREAGLCLENDLIYPAYDYVMKMSHLFNSLDARGVLSVSGRASMVGDVRTMANRVARGYLDTRYGEEESS